MSNVLYDKHVYLYVCTYIHRGNDLPLSLHRDHRSVPSKTPIIRCCVVRHTSTPMKRLRAANPPNGFCKKVKTDAYKTQGATRKLWILNGCQN